MPAWQVGSIAWTGLCLALVSADATPPQRQLSRVGPIAFSKELKLQPEKAQLDPNKWTGGACTVSRHFQLYWDDWRGIDPTAREAAKKFLDANSFEKMIVAAGAVHRCRTSTSGGNR